MLKCKKSPLVFSLHLIGRKGGDEIEAYLDHSRLLRMIQSLEKGLKFKELKLSIIVRLTCLEELVHLATIG